MASICPISQDEIVCAINLDNVEFELDSILNHLRVNRELSKHPYTQRPFTDTQLRSIYLAALQHNPSFLMEQGWFMPSGFLGSLRPAEPAASPPLRPPQESCLTPHESYVLALVLFMFLLVFIVFMRWIA
jgi:hypothetical protein